MNYETVIGLEVHAQLLTRTKLFCPCSTEFGREPNHNTCPVCLGLPGVLPVLNRRSVEFAVRAGLAAGCRIAPKSVFARKNYFYPDLPKGYQISQYELPICSGGRIGIETESGQKTIGLTRIHIEEDAGKLLHEHPESRSKEASWVDFNRSGVPLLEIVSEPEMRSPAEAVLYLKKLRALLIALDICDGNMEEGSFRCDANISLRPTGQKEFGTKVELKNMNSFRHVEKGLQFEIERQRGLLEEGDKIVQETRLWDAERGETKSMRGKEEAHDYRYFPDPDLLPLLIDDGWIGKIRESLPELPDAKKERFVSQHGLPAYDASVLTQDKEVARFFEECVAGYPQPKKVANWVINEFLRLIQGDGSRIARTPLKPADVAKTMGLVDQGKISGSVAKTVLQKVFETGVSPDEVVEKEGLSQISDDRSIEEAIDRVIAANPKESDRFRKGEEKLAGFFVGRVMKETGGRANPAKVNTLLIQRLKSG